MKSEKQENLAGLHLEMLQIVLTESKEAMKSYITFCMEAV